MDPSPPPNQKPNHHSSHERHDAMPLQSPHLLLEPERAALRSLKQAAKVAGLDLVVGVYGGTVWRSAHHATTFSADTRGQ
jgi:hypothetical protein